MTYLYYEGGVDHYYAGIKLGGGSVVSMCGMSFTSIRPRRQPLHRVCSMCLTAESKQGKV